MCEEDEVEYEQVNTIIPEMIESEDSNKTEIRSYCDQIYNDSESDYFSDEISSQEN